MGGMCWLADVFGRPSIAKKAVIPRVKKKLLKGYEKYYLVLNFTEICINGNKSIRIFKETEYAWR